MNRSATITNIRPCVESHDMPVYLIVTAQELTGLQPRSHADITRDFFADQRRKDPNVSLDDAILRFENAADSYPSLHAFATARCRTAESYRKVYRPFWT